MNDKTFRVLEYNKILNKLSEYTENGVVLERIKSLKPIFDLGEIKRLQGETTEGVNIILRRGNAPNLSIYNVIGAVRRLEIGGILSLKELLEVANMLKVTRNIKRYINDSEGFLVLDGFAAGLCPLAEVESRISDIVISEDDVADHASRELQTIRRSIRAANDKVKELLNNIIHSTTHQKYLQDSIITMRGNRYVVPVKAEHKSDVAGIVHDASSSGATLFIEPMSVVNANNELRELAIRERQEIERILAELSAMAGEHAAEFLANYNIIMELDFIFARAKLSILNNAIEPRLNDHQYINIKKSRHPLLDPKSVVPVDIYLGQEFDTLIITGPNTGGKTVALKTIGLFVLMAQSGLHIPAAEDSEMGLFEQVFADIGDEQSIEQSLSTFSAHMTNIVDILGKVDYKTLVLFDELGAGTDPVEGAALAMSILEYARNMGARVAATTHYSELKMFALSTQGVENAACEFDVETLRPTYRLLIGVPGKSNAFAISKRLGLSDYVITRANELLTEENIKFEDVISKLEQNRQGAEEEKQRAESYKNQIEQIKLKLEEEKIKFEKQRTELLEKAKQKALEIVSEAQDEAKDVIREINKISKDLANSDYGKRFDEQRKRLKENFDKLSSQKGKNERVTEIPKGLVAGNTVEIISLSQTATVMAPEDSNGDVMLQAGIMKIRANVRDLRLVVDDNTKQAVQNIIKNRGGGLSKAQSIKTELDIRGQNVFEATEVLDKYLDDVSIAALSQVSIIHGKGTGVLRQGIHEFLKRDKRIKSYRLGRYGEGENGVTIIEMK